MKNGFRKKVLLLKENDVSNVHTVLVSDSKSQNTGNDPCAS